jgi:hypothetical protein
MLLPAGPQILIQECNPMLAPAGEPALRKTRRLLARGGVFCPLRPAATIVSSLALVGNSDPMKKTLRSNFEPGSPREAARRAQWKALGLSDEDTLKPKIAVVNTSSELAICFSHLDGIARLVKEAVRAAGGLPFEIRTAAPSDFIIGAGSAGGYILAARDLS